MAPEEYHSLHEVTNSVHGVYSILCNRWTMLELRGQLEQEPGSSHRGGADALRAKLQFVEDRVYQASDDVVADEVLQQWLNDFDRSRRKAMLSTTAKSAATVDARSGKDYERLRWRRGPPPPSDHGVSLKDATPQQQKWLDVEKERLLANGNAEEAAQVIKHLCLEVDLKQSQFRVTEHRVHKIHVKAKQFLCDAARNRQWLPARRLASFTGLCQSVYLAVPAARLYLRELYFVLTDKRSCGAKWGPSPVDRFASEISAQLPCYYAAWRDPLCEGVDSLAYDGRGENNWALKVGRCNVSHRGLPVSYYTAEVHKSSSACTTANKVTVSTRIKVCWKDDDQFYPGVVKEFNDDGKAHVMYDDGDEETLDLSEKNLNILCSSGVMELNGETSRLDN
ncbi:hypothetical protein CYMTET_52279 [Cymbomonas tetramitiformis]|uniref:Uncharacterized protein n=1 Tax=Cymbomonas tetramitiformis TaxID=36881 RepID=A0AAE0BKI3_9CHLO|nr:hypothetical protein CYMTET_52279 [Cymbomonas tetramitiformis]